MLNQASKHIPENLGLHINDIVFEVSELFYNDMRHQSSRVSKFKNHERLFTNYVERVEQQKQSLDTLKKLATKKTTSRNYAKILTQSIEFFKLHEHSGKSTTSEDRNYHTTFLKYGITLCSNLFPYIRSRKNSAKFDDLYFLVWGITFNSFGRNLFWHEDDYEIAFEIGLEWLLLSSKVQPDNPFFVLDDGYGIKHVNIFRSNDPHNHSMECFEINYLKFNPHYLITKSIGKSEFKNKFIRNAINQKIRSIMNRK